MNTKFNFLHRHLLIFIVIKYVGEIERENDIIFTVVHRLLLYTETMRMTQSIFPAPCAFINVVFSNGKHMFLYNDECQSDTRVECLLLYYIFYIRNISQHNIRNENLKRWGELLPSSFGALIYHRVYFHFSSEYNSVCLGWLTGWLAGCRLLKLTVGTSAMCSQLGKT